MAALRAGATTPWTAWSGEGEQAGRQLPGAQNLELLRRVNAESARRGTHTDPVLADRILSASPAGRGLPELALSGVGSAPRFGPPPVDPESLPGRELLRIATGLVADDLAALASTRAADEPRSPERRVRRPWAPSYLLVGHELLVDWVGRDLAEQGRRPRADPRRVYVLGDSVEAMVRDAWTARALREGGGPWLSWIRGLAKADRLPNRADLVAPTTIWAERIGAGRVALVLDREQLRGPLRVRRIASPPELGGAAVDLIRRVNRSLAAKVPPESRTDLLRRLLVPRLTGEGGPPVGVPDEIAGWLADRAQRMRSQLAAAGVPVLGSLDRLVEPVADGALPANPPADDVLALGIRLLLSPVSAQA